MARCDYFANMFSGSWMERIGGRAVKVFETSPGAFRSLLLYLYTGDTNVVDVEEVLPLRKLADQYMLDELMRYCDFFIESHLINENAVSCFLWSDVNTPPHDRVLRDACKAYVVKHWKEIKEEFPDSLAQLKKEPDLLLDIIDGFAD